MMRRGLAILLLAGALTASVAAAQTLQVTPLPRDGRVLVTFKLADAFTDEIRAAIHSGLTISFVYRVELKRSSALWLDSTIASTEIAATVRYDNLTRAITSRGCRTAASSGPRRPSAKRTPARG